MEINTRECMFCHGGLPVKEGQPVNLAFMEHIERLEPCREAFDVWRLHMQKDYQGD
jgi:hypothetical protein